jgi:hypothetical protein
MMLREKKLRKNWHNSATKRLPIFNIKLPQGEYKKIF